MQLQHGMCLSPRELLRVYRRQQGYNSCNGSSNETAVSSLHALSPSRSQLKLLAHSLSQPRLLHSQSQSLLQSHRLPPQHTLSPLKGAQRTHAQPGPLPASLPSLQPGTAAAHGHSPHIGHGHGDASASLRPLDSRAMAGLAFPPRANVGVGGTLSARGSNDSSVVTSGSAAQGSETDRTVPGGQRGDLTLAQVLSAMNLNRVKR